MSTLKDWDSKLQFSFGLASIVVLLLVSCCKNCRREIPVASVVGRKTPLSAEERKRLLNTFFEIGNRRLRLTMENFSMSPEVGFDIESTNSTKEGDEGHDDDDGDAMMEMMHLKIPGEENERLCPNFCVICLDPYKVDDVVVWSSDPDCRHAFHQGCLVEALSKAQNDEAPCPCCRIMFCDIQALVRQ